MADCLFCKIVSGEIPSTLVYEDDLVFAVEDVNPEAPVHVLILTKEHYKNLNDDVPDETLVAVLKAAREIAKLKGVDESGYRVVTNTGMNADQTVYHMHFHLLGGTSLVGQTH